MKLRAILRRSIVFSLLAVLVVTLWTTAAIADTPATTPDVGQAAMSLWDGLRIGAYGIVGLAVLEMAELGLLALADRDGSRLKPAIPYLSVAAAVTATATAALVASGAKAGLMAAVTALFTALVAHYKTPAARAASDTPAQTKAAQGGFVAAWLLAFGTIAAIVIGSVFAASACGPTGKKIEADAIACAKDVASGLPSSLEQDVIGWLTDTALSDADIKAKLEALAAGAAQTGLAGGEQAIVCIVQAAVADLEKSLTGQLGTGSAAHSPDALGVARGKAWLAAHQAH